MEKTNKGLREKDIIRKIIHILLGLFFIITIHYLSREEEILLTGVLIILGIIISAIERKQRIKVISKILDIVEDEPERTKFPGKEAIMYVLGVFISLILLNKTYTMIGVFVLAIGDPISRIIGELFGRVKIPWNNLKHAEGRVISTIICGATLIIMYRNPLMAMPPAVAMLFETLPLKIGDNLIIIITTSILSALINPLRFI